VRIAIVGHDLPGRRFVSEGVELENVHVALQEGRDPVGAVPADAPSARWAADVRAVADAAGLDLRGPAIHGKRGERFVYLTWGDVGADGSFAMFRRAKLMVGDIDPALLAAAADDGTLIGELGLTDARGGPVCARVRPPAITWRLG
jgi:hypothetical protein